MSKEIKIALIGAVATVLAAIIGGIFLLNNQSANQHSAPTTSSPVPITSATTQSTPFATTSTPSPTPTPITITKNLDIPCNSCSFKLDIKLTTIVIDTTKQKSTWNFTLTNNDVPFHFYFSTLVLEDNTGQMHQGGGLAATDHWNMNSGQSIQTYATFDVVHGTNYSLNMVLDSGEEIYQTVTITF